MNLNFLIVDHDAAEPPYEQLRRQITEVIDSGGLAPGEKLPPVRRLAEDLGLAANTVAKAYKELEARGVVATRGRAGTTVLGAGADRAAREAAAVYARTVRTLGLSEADAVGLLTQAYRT
ncbi:GntR family transcriptional regulator [Nocardioides yefusunii]|uniref:GntR family transcriptional regulator n=1 Tax=Nocardioides yefusunii TaxID=2500546 RepID=A0ABW1QRY9_9ACTN|nr:GntR family transcriptional regulator [Nocardioides yefusunii]